MFNRVTLLTLSLALYFLISTQTKTNEDEGNYESSLVCYEYSQETPDFSVLNQCPDGNSQFDLKSCPPGFHKISALNYDYCYQISNHSVWDYPCYRSGGASVITDFSVEEINALLNSLEQKNISRYFWLPAKRQKLFNPVVWYIPGPNWGLQFEYNTTVGAFGKYTSLLKNCLVLDVQQRMITTDVCNMEYPSLCFYLNELLYPALCPNGYHAFRFMFDVGKCYGIEQSDGRYRLTFDDFTKDKCAKPMGAGEGRNNDLTKFIYKKIAVLSDLSHEWCWFGSSSNKNSSSLLPVATNSNASMTHHHNSFEAIININGTLAYTSTSATLSCMACEAEMIFASKETVLNLEYNSVDTSLYLTVYYPSALWKYDAQDKGIQCFSDAKGFVKVIDENFVVMREIDIRHDPYRNYHEQESEVEQAMYAINPITDRSAQYWCEGHTKNFTLVTTNKLVVNPKGDKLHVFALVIKHHPSLKDEQQEFPDVPNISTLIADIESVFQAEKALLMDVLEYTQTGMLFLVHLHIKLYDAHQSLSDNIVATLNILQSKSKNELIQFNITFVNVSSSVYCLPTQSLDFMTLDWELTEIGHTVSPRQFCLQDNGLPVTRNCGGSYLFGGIWGEVTGYCNNNYQPSQTTTFLYKFVKGEISDNYASRFLTDGLSFVLQDIDIIIPADIYYLAVSLKQVLDIAEQNRSLIDMGDIDNIAWVMDRILALDNEYLRLAQSLNSTNLILDSVDEIMEILAKLHLSNNRKAQKNKYFVSIKPQFVLQISYPGFDNITGIAISGNILSETFDNMIVQPLYKNCTLESVLSINDIVIAAWLPESVVDTLRQNTNESLDCEQSKNELHIITSIYYNDVVFQQLDKSHNVVNSRIIGMSVPGYLSDLVHPMPLVFKEISRSNYSRHCGYWDFQTKKTGETPGYWDYRGCYHVGLLDDVSVCHCYHMTHFGQLLDFGDKQRPDREIDRKHGKALNIITLVGCFLSLVGVVGIWLTAAVFQTWRKKAGTKVLLQLSTAIALPLIFIIIFNLDNHIFVVEDGKYFVADDMKSVCILLGALLHYSILASFVWMLIAAILQFVRYVRVLGVCRPSRFMMKLTFIGWGIPFIPVVFVLVFDSENYLPDVSSSNSVKGPICYTRGFYFFMAVLLPVCIILLINIILFILVLYSISHGPDGKMRATDMDLVGAQFRLSVFLFFLLGLTWVFGLISFSGNLLWSYLFCLTSTLQGFILFIYFIVCDPSTRKLWVTLMKPPLKGTPRDSITSLGLSSS